LRGRGGYEVDITWRDGKVTDFQVRHPEQKPATVRVNGELRSVETTSFPDT
jgi:hypothetical protein